MVNREDGGEGTLEKDSLTEEPVSEGSQVNLLIISQPNLALIRRACQGLVNPRQTDAEHLLAALGGIL